MTRVGQGWTSGGLALGACLLALACGTLHNPTEPKPAPEKNSVSTPPDPGGLPAPVFGGPAASPSPSPSPATDPSGQATPPPSSGEGGTECGQPLPPPVTIIDVKVHLRGSDAWVLDSTPLVGPDLEYCRKIGFTDNRSVCPVRPEGNPQRSACELYAIGRAKDTNRPGPTWYRNGNFCTGRASGCENNGDNQFLLNAFSGGRYQACARTGICGEVEVDR